MAKVMTQAEIDSAQLALRLAELTATAHGAELAPTKLSLGNKAARTTVESDGASAASAASFRRDVEASKSAQHSVSFASKDVLAEKWSAKRSGEVGKNGALAIIDSYLVVRTTGQMLAAIAKQTGKDADIQAALEVLETESAVAQSDEWKADYKTFLAEHKGS